MTTTAGFFDGRYDPTTDKVVPKDAIVLDLTEEGLRLLRGGLARWGQWTSLSDEAVAIGGLLDQIEAQTKPPRIPEPGLWGVVEATTERGNRREFVRYPDGWRARNYLSSLDWLDVVDPVLVRPGIEDQS